MKYPELNTFVQFYNNFLPLRTFPWVMLMLASIAQYAAWWGSQFIFPNVSLVKKVIFSWLIVFIEFTILIPSLNISVMILGYDETYLFILTKVFQIVIFYGLNNYILHAPFTKKYILSFIFMILSLSIVII